ncbi:hypothetical protein TNCV_3051531 [Trichonephila clavipes]|nr:hypothetical protein TNCV_3051531 [Trichonephila clavipes]
MLNLAKSLVCSLRSSGSEETSNTYRGMFLRTTTCRKLIPVPCSKAASNNDLPPFNFNSKWHPTLLSESSARHGR